MKTDTARTAMRGASGGRAHGNRRAFRVRNNSRVAGDGPENATAIRSKLYERLSLNALLLIAQTRDLDLPDGAQRHEVLGRLRTYDEQPPEAETKPRATASRLPQRP